MISIEGEGTLEAQADRTVGVAEDDGVVELAVENEASTDSYRNPIHNSRGIRQRKRFKAFLRVKMSYFDKKIKRRVPLVS